MRKFLGTALLALALSGAVDAGDMPINVAGNMPIDYTKPTAEQPPPTGGEIPFGTQGATIEAVLPILASALSLF
jgi:hypothetical protein